MNIMDTQKTATPNKDSIKIFLSYQWNIQDQVKKLKVFLENNNFSTWIDIHHLKADGDILAELRNAIHNANVFICCITKAYLLSHCKEISYANMLNKPIIPLMFENVPMNELGSVGFIINPLKIINLYQDQETLNNWTGSTSQQLIKIISNSINVDAKENISIKEDKKKHQLDLMISYASQTFDKVQLIQRALESFGYTVWIDDQDMRGKLFEDMAKGIEKSSHIIACVSEFYENSRYCQKELAYAIRIEKPIIPIIVQKEYDPKGWLGVAISVVRSYKITDKIELEAVFPQVLEIINKIKA